MSVKRWYLDPNGDGTADVYRGDTSTPIKSNVKYTPKNDRPETVVGDVMDGEISPELPEQSSAGNAGNDKGLSQRGGELLHERAAMKVIIGPPPSLQ